MACKFTLDELKIQLQRYSFLSEVFHKAFQKVFGEGKIEKDVSLKIPELPEVVRYGYKNYATLGFAALYSNLRVEDDEETTEENRGRLHDMASSMIPETFLANVFKGILGLNSRYDFLNIRDIPEEESEFEGPYYKLLRKYKNLVETNTPFPIR